MSSSRSTHISQQRVPWNLRDMLLASAASIGLGLLGITFIVGGSLLWETAGLPAPSQSTRLLGVFSLEAILLIPAWVWGPGKYGGGWKALGFRSCNLRQTAILWGKAFLSILAINIGWEWTRRRLGIPGQPDYLPLFGKGLGGLFLALLLGAIIAPIAEETFFRGYLYAGLRSLWGPSKGIVLSAAIFAAVHILPGVLFPIFLIGLVLAWLYERTGSLWPSIVLHGAMNALAFLASYFAKQFPT